MSQDRYFCQVAGNNRWTRISVLLFSVDFNKPVWFPPWFNIRETEQIPQPPFWKEYQKHKVMKTTRGSNRLCVLINFRWWHKHYWVERAGIVPATSQRSTTNCFCTFILQSNDIGSSADYTRSNKNMETQCFVMARNLVKELRALWYFCRSLTLLNNDGRMISDKLGIQNKHTGTQPFQTF